MLLQKHTVLLLVGMSLPIVCSCGQQPKENVPSKSGVSEPDPSASPVQTPETTRLVDAAEYADGGTIFVHLVGTQGKRIQLCVSQHAWDSTIPKNTLFLNANHPSDPKARLPSSTEEATGVLEALRQAVNAAIPDAELAGLERLGDPLETFWHDKYAKPDDEQRSRDEWVAIFAFDALRRLEKQSKFEVRSVDASTSPDWYEAFDTERHEKLAEQQREAEIDTRFKSFYPEPVRTLFDMQNSEQSVEVKPSDSDTDSDEDPLKQQGQRLADAVNDPVKLAAITCKALGSIDDSWTSTIDRDRLAIQAMLTVQPKDFLAALPELQENQQALLGAGRVFFYLRYGEAFSGSDWEEWGPKITKTVLTEGIDDNKSMVLGILSVTPHEGVVPLLRGIASGDIGKEPKIEDQWDQEPGLKVSAYLALAHKGDESIQEEVQALLNDEKLEQNKAALEVCLALLGDPNQIKPEHFEYRSHSIGFGALKAIERFEGKHGMDVLMTSALEHPWAAVANEAMLVAQRITGQEWLPEGSNHQPRNFSDEAKAWWQANGKEFVESAAQK